MVATKRPTMGTLAERLAHARGLAGLSSNRLSLLAGLSKSHVALIEGELRLKLGMETVSRLAVTLGVSSDWLNAGDGPPPTEDQVKRAVAAAESAHARAS